MEIKLIGTIEEPSGHS